MKYSKTEHLKLLKSVQKSESLQKSEISRKILSNDEFLKLLEFEVDEDFFKLKPYTIMLISHLQWENREEYFQFIEELLNGPINFLPIRKKYRAINDAVEMLEAKLILFEPNPKSEGFADLMDEVVSLFDRYCPDSYFRESHEFSEEQLKKLIQKIFIKMKNGYP